MSQRTNTSPVPRRVLVVDDSAGIRRMLALQLRHAGFDVVEACTGEEALNRFRDEPVQVVVTDVNMPGRGGLHLLAELRRGPSDTEVILLSGVQADNQEATREARRLGVRHYVPKAPAALEAVVLAVEDAVERLRSCNEGDGAEGRPDRAVGGPTTARPR